MLTRGDRVRPGVILGAVLVAGSLFAAHELQAAESLLVEPVDDVAALRAEIERQRQALKAQEEAIQAQRRRLENLENKIYATGSATIAPATQPAVYRAAPPEKQSGGKYIQAQSQNGSTVGEAPEEDGTRPEIGALADAGGVLTPEGTLVIEPQIVYSHSSNNRFVFQGFELAEVVLIGAIEASEADRNTVVPSVTARYGITSRLEADVKVPYVIREATVTNTIVTTSPATSRVTDTTGTGLGDVEFGVHYQINDGRNDWPFFIANLNVKSDTGSSPFEVDRDSAGVEEELATGNGFWGIEPSLTVIYPTDPAVFFVSGGYQWNIARDVNETIGGNRIGRVDPGDSIRGSVGMGFAINQNSSFSIGYKHDYIMETTTEINGTDRDSDDLHAGSIFLGFSQRLSDNVKVHLTAEGGVTDNAPDVVLGLRVPVSLDLF